MLSADAMPDSIRKLKHLGATDYIVKPLNVSEFIQVVDKNIASSKSAP